jgi:hypothetical protein
VNLGVDEARRACEKQLLEDANAARGVAHSLPGCSVARFFCVVLEWTATQSCFHTIRVPPKASGCRRLIPSGCRRLIPDVCECLPGEGTSNLDDQCRTADGMSHVRSYGDTNKGQYAPGCLRSSCHIAVIKKNGLELIIMYRGGPILRIPTTGLRGCPARSVHCLARFRFPVF